MGAQLCHIFSSLLHLNLAFPWNTLLTLDPFRTYDGEGHFQNLPLTFSLHVHLLGAVVGADDAGDGDGEAECVAAAVDEEYVGAGFAAGAGAVGN